jgi:hypothetical protein
VISRAGGSSGGGSSSGGAPPSSEPPAEEVKLCGSHCDVDKCSNRRVYIRGLTSDVTRDMISDCFQGIGTLARERPKGRGIYKDQVRGRMLCCHCRRVLLHAVGFQSVKLWPSVVCVFSCVSQPQLSFAYVQTRTRTCTHYTHHASPTRRCHLKSRSTTVALTA